MPTLKLQALNKHYSKKHALKNFSFTFQNGVYGLLGPNGAGKSTTMNILSGYLAPTEGTVRIGGCDIVEDSLRARELIGYLPELPPVYMDMTPLEYLRFVAEAKGIARARLRGEIQRVMDRTGVTDVKDRLIKNLSKGYRQRVGMAQAILGDVKVVILDEPAAGLDPIQMVEFRELVRDLGKDHTVILSSHILSEVSEVCQKIMIIVRGRLAAIDTPENLAKKIGETGTALSLEEIFLELTESEKNAEKASENTNDTEENNTEENNTEESNTDSLETEAPAENIKGEEENDGSL